MTFYIIDNYKHVEFVRYNIHTTTVCTNDLNNLKVLV